MTVLQLAPQAGCGVEHRRQPWSGTGTDQDSPVLLVAVVVPDPGIEDDDVCEPRLQVSPRGAAFHGGEGLEDQVQGVEAMIRWDVLGVKPADHIHAKGKGFALCLVSELTHDDPARSVP